RPPGTAPSPRRATCRSRCPGPCRRGDHAEGRHTAPAAQGALSGPRAARRYRRRAPTARSAAASAAAARRPPVGGASATAPPQLPISPFPFDPPEDPGAGVGGGVEGGDDGEGLKITST